MDQDNFEQKILNLEQRIEKLESIMLNPSAVIKGEIKKTSVKEFLLLKKPDNDVKRALLIAYFLEKFRNFGSFNIEDLKNGFREAKLKMPSNINDRVNMNIGNDHMMNAGEKKDGKTAWVLTATGETYVENDS